MSIGRLALDDPFGELPAGAAGGGDAEGVALVQPEIRQVPGRADDRAAVRRVGDGAVVDLLDADLAEGRHARRWPSRYAARAGRGPPGRARIRCRSAGPSTIAGRARPSRRGRGAGRRPPRACTRSESASRSTPISGRPWRWRSTIAGCGSVTMYWCSTGMTGTSSPTIAPVRRAKLPVARDDVLAGDVALVGLHQPLAGRRAARSPVTVGVAVDLRAAARARPWPAPGSGRPAGCSRRRDAGSRRGCRRSRRAARSPSPRRA